MIETERWNAALRYAGEKHRGQTRKGGLPYITHPVAVAEMLRQQGYDETVQIIGLFHDLLEDTDAKETELEALAGRESVKVVRLLTKRKGYIMEDYIGAILQDPIAKAVKTADRLHNLRSAVEASENFRRRYIRETRDWFLNFSPEILPAVEALEATLTDGGKDEKR